MKKYDLVVIGAGPMGTPITMEYAKLNKDKRVLLVDDKGEPGGECLFDGCIPSKILEVSGEHFKYLQKLKSFGIEIQNIHPKLIWETLVNKKKEILVDRAKSAYESLNFFSNVTIQKGWASFLSDNSLKISDEEKEEIIQFSKVVIATGSRTFIPSFRGNGLEKVWDNKIFFDQMILPESITIIGNGPSGIEFCQILSKLGVKVNLIGDVDKILPMIDEEFSDILLKKILLDQNINLILGAKVEEINFHNNSFQLKYIQNSQEQEISSEKVLIATGRTPNIEKLDLEKARVDFQRKGVIVNQYLQTTNPNIYAGGDVAYGSPQFAHTASYSAHIVAQNLFFGKNKFKTDFTKNSWVLFSDPNIVSAGLSEKQAQAKGLEIITGVYDYSIDAKAQIDNEAVGYLKYVVDKKTLRIIGVHIIAENAHTLAGEAGVIVSNQLTLKDLVETIHSHPTLSESFGFLAKNMMGDVMDKMMKTPMFKVGFFVKKWL